MKRRTRLLIYVWLVAWCAVLYIFTKRPPLPPPPPLPHSRGNVLYLLMDDAFATLWRSSEAKVGMHSAVRSSRGQQVRATATLWGQGSSRLKETKRRSLVVELLDHATMTFDGVQLDRWMLLSLFEDEYRVSYQTAIRITEKLGLWHSYSQLLELRCFTPSGTTQRGAAMELCGESTEGRSLGLYLLVQHPYDGITAVSEHSEYSDNCADVISSEYRYVEKSDAAAGVRDIAYRFTDKDRVEQLVGVPLDSHMVGIDASHRVLPDVYAALLSGIAKRGGPDQNAALVGVEQVIDLGMYLHWLAFNTIVMNGDYIDEVYFHAPYDKPGHPLQLIGWDYDRLLQPCHPVPMKYRLPRVKDPLFYCAESKLDHYIHRNATLRRQYVAVLNCTLHEVTPDAFAAALHTTMEEVRSVLNRSEADKATWEGDPAKRGLEHVIRGAADMMKQFKSNHQTLLRDVAEAIGVDAGSSVDMIEDQVQELEHATLRNVPAIGQAAGKSLALAFNCSHEDVISVGRTMGASAVIGARWGANERKNNLLRVTLQLLPYSVDVDSTDVVYFLVTSATAPTVRDTECIVTRFPAQLLGGQLYLLLGPKQSQELLTNINAPRELTVTSNTYGYGGVWDSLSDVFEAGTRMCVAHVVLRNHENLGQIADHPDVDMMVAVYTKACWVMIGQLDRCVIERNKPMLRSVTAGGHSTKFDMIEVGDGYYDPHWQLDMLRTRVVGDSDVGYNVLEKSYYFYSLLYHAVLHKPAIADIYIPRLQRLALDAGVGNVTDFSLHALMLTLDRFMVSHEYTYTVPRNKFVAFQPSRCTPWKGFCESHLVILWERALVPPALELHNTIMSELRSNFSVQWVRNVSWPESCFLDNMQRFYDDIAASFLEKKIVRCGGRVAKVVHFIDFHPNYEKRKTGKGHKKVNTNVFDMKQKYRQLLGKIYDMQQTNPYGYKFYMDCFHGTNNKPEVDHDLQNFVPELTQQMYGAGASGTGVAQHDHARAAPVQFVRKVSWPESCPRRAWRRRSFAASSTSSTFPNYDKHKTELPEGYGDAASKASIRTLRLPNAISRDV